MAKFEDYLIEKCNGFTTQKQYEETITETSAKKSSTKISCDAEYIKKERVLKCLQEILNDPNCPLFVSATVIQLISEMPADFVASKNEQSKTIIQELNDVKAQLAACMLQRNALEGVVSAQKQRIVNLEKAYKI